MSTKVVHSIYCRYISEKMEEVGAPMARQLVCLYCLSLYWKKFWSKMILQYFKISYFVVSSMWLWSSIEPMMSFSLSVGTRIFVYIFLIPKDVSSYVLMKHLSSLIKVLWCFSYCKHLLEVYNVQYMKKVLRKCMCWGICPVYYRP